MEEVKRENILSDINKPTFLVDAAKASVNISRMVSRANTGGAMLRPHFKTHQSHQVGALFKNFGVQRIAVSSVSMAEYFADGGWSDIMIAFPVNIREIDRINKLAKRVTLGILVSTEGVSPQLAAKLQSRVRMYIEVDVGANRTGFLPDAVEQIAKAIAQAEKNPWIKFSGFVAHAGHTYQTQNTQQVREIHMHGMNSLNRLKEQFQRQHPDIVVSWGDTPSCMMAEDFFGAEELRPGNFVYFDVMQWQLGACAMEEIAVVVAAPVVAVYPKRNELVVYGGAVHLSKESVLCNQGFPHFGMMVLLNENGSWELPSSPCFVRRITQEHGVIALPNDFANSFSVGDLVGILPVHSCLTADLLRNYTVFLH